MLHRNRLIAPAFAVLALVLLAGCAGQSSFMRDVPAEQADYTPKADQALMVFMRPSGLGFAVQSTVFDITSGEPKLVGIVSAKTKLAYDVPEGESLFMVVGESADFMSAEVEAGKTYYALVTPRMGFWKARFSLKPVTKGELSGEQFAKWLDDCRWVENTARSQEWMDGNIKSIRSKQTEYWPKWEAKPNKPVLRETDGI